MNSPSWVPSFLLLLSIAGAQERQPWPAIADSIPRYRAQDDRVRLTPTEKKPEDRGWTSRDSYFQPGAWRPVWNPPPEPREIPQQNRRQGARPSTDARTIRDMGVSDSGRRLWQPVWYHRWADDSRTRDPEAQKLTQDYSAPEGKNESPPLGDSIALVTNQLLNSVPDVVSNEEATTLDDLESDMATSDSPSEEEDMETSEESIIYEPISIQTPQRTESSTVMTSTTQEASEVTPQSSVATTKMNHATGTTVTMPSATLFPSRRHPPTALGLSASTGHHFSTTSGAPPVTSGLSTWTMLSNQGSSKGPSTVIWGTTPVEVVAEMNTKATSQPSYSSLSTIPSTTPKPLTSLITSSTKKQPTSTIHSTSTTKPTVASALKPSTTKPLSTKLPSRKPSEPSTTATTKPSLTTNKRISTITTSKPTIVRKTPTPIPVTVVNSPSTAEVTSTTVKTTSKRNSTSGVTGRPTRRPSGNKRRPQNPPRTRPQSVSTTGSGNSQKTGSKPSQSPSTAVSTNKVTKKPELSASTSEQDSSNTVTQAPGPSSTTKRTRKRPRPTRRPGTSGSKKKKNKNRRRRPKPSRKASNVTTTTPEPEEILETQLNNTSPANLSTRIYNFIAREVMPNVGVGLIGLVVTAGLAGLLFYPNLPGFKRRRSDMEEDENNDFLTLVQKVLTAVVTGQTQFERGPRTLTRRRRFAGGDDENELNNEIMDYEVPAYMPQKLSGFHQPLLKTDFKIPENMHQEEISSSTPQIAPENLSLAPFEDIDADKANTDKIVSEGLQDSSTVTQSPHDVATTQNIETADTSSHVSGEPFTLFGLVTRLAEMKLRFGLGLLRSTSDVLSGYLEKVKQVREELNKPSSQVVSVRSADVAVPDSPISTSLRQETTHLRRRVSRSKEQRNKEQVPTSVTSKKRRKQPKVLNVR